MNGKHKKPFLNICNGAKYSAGGMALKKRLIKSFQTNKRSTTYSARLLFVLKYPCHLTSPLQETFLESMSLLTSLLREILGMIILWAHIHCTNPCSVVEGGVKL